MDARLLPCTILAANPSVETEFPKRLLNRRYLQSITRAACEERSMRSRRVARLVTTLRISHHTFVQVIANRDDSGLVKLGFLNDELPGEQINVRHPQCEGLADSQSS